MKKILFTLLSTASMVAVAIALGAPAQARQLFVRTVESPTVVRERVHVVRPLHRRHMRMIAPGLVMRTRESRVRINEPNRRVILRSKITAPTMPDERARIERY